MTHVPELRSVTEERMFTQAEFDRFGTLSGDRNPIHVDPAFAVDTPFGATVAHGMLLFSALRALAARTWPGAALREQDLMFPAPTYADEPVQLRLDPVAAEDARTWRVTTRVVKPDGRLGVEGECVLVFPEARS